MLRYFRMLRERLQLTWGNKDMRVTLLFGLEGLMLQYVTSITGSATTCTPPTSP